MIDKPDGTAQQPDRLSLSRWSRRKLEAARAQATPPREVVPAPPATAPQSQQAPQAAGGAPQNAAAALPPIESLTIDSEFAAFFKPDVPEATKRAALKQLFRDPRFNVMDGLDVYIDDYTQPDPIPAEMMKQLLHTRHIFDPPQTEVNAQGQVVDKVLPPAERPEAVAGEAKPPVASALPAPALADGERATQADGDGGSPTGDDATPV